MSLESAVLSNGVKILKNLPKYFLNQNWKTYMFAQRLAKHLESHTKSTLPIEAFDFDMAVLKSSDVLKVPGYLGLNGEPVQSQVLAVVDVAFPYFVEELRQYYDSFNRFRENINNL